MTAGSDKAQREALAQALHAMPAAMRALPQWLMWAYVQKKGAPKPAKLPYYANGNLRGWPQGRPKNGQATEAQPQVDQGHDLDRAALVSFDEALAVLQRSGRYDGIGFAFLPGDGLIGVDIDDAVTEDGEISRLCQLVMTACPSYTERSVSGRGVHIILSGEPAAFKSDAIGLEVYAGRQFFTCTGAHWSGTPAEVQEIDPMALTIMRGMVDQANDEVRRKREADRAAKHLSAGTTQPTPSATSTGGDDFQRVNERALSNLQAWVPSLLPAAKPHNTVHGPGYRITSKALGRDLQEDLALTPGGIHDFGEECGKSPIDVVVQWGGKTPVEAMRWLAERCGVNVTPARAPRAARAASTSSSDRRPEPPPEGMLPSDEGAAPGRGRSGAEGPPGSAGGGDEGSPPHPPPEESEAELRAGKGGGGRRKPPRVDPDVLTRVFQRYVYQYGSDVAWDIERREPIKISSLRITWGKAPINIWLASPERRMVFLEDIVFEPGQQVPEHQINLFTGLPLQPVEGDCAVMVELLHFLCSTSEAPGMGPEDIADWVLRWCALPLQRLGAKMDTALVFHGPMGTGKNLFFDVLRDLYGDYGVMVGQTELEDKYNAWLSRRMLIVGDEVVSKQEMHHVKNRLKWIVTQKSKIPIRAMQQDTRWENNHANLVFLSNESQPLALEDGDRRYMVVYTPTADRGDLYARVGEFLEAGGAAKFLHFLMHLDLEGFNEHTKPPLTQAKATLIEMGLKPAERFMREWISGFLPLPQRVCSVEQLYRCFQRWCGQAGERWPPSQALFTEQSRRYAKERVELDADGEQLAPRFDVRVIAVPDPTKATGRTSVRCWIPRGCGPQDGRTWGEWAVEAIDEFEPTARGFLRRHHIDDDEPPHGV